MPDSQMPDSQAPGGPGGRQRRSRVAVAVGLVTMLAVVVAFVAALSQTLSTTGSRGGEVAALPPILPGEGTPVQPTVAAGQRVMIPEGFLEPEARMATPLHQEGVRWTRTDELGLPPLVSPCGGNLPSDAAAVGGRQLALIGSLGWKAERLVVYRDVAAARSALAERRAALRACARHDDGGGIMTVWTAQPLRIGEEALFVAGQRYRGGTPVHGHTRGILLRQGRAVVMYVDFGQLDKPATLAEVASYERDARTMAATLAAAPWAQAT